MLVVDPLPDKGWLSLYTAKRGSGLQRFLTGVWRYLECDMQKAFLRFFINQPSRKGKWELLDELA